MSSLLPHRRALVTGASSGIGAATARRLAVAGYRVALLARRQEALEEVRASLHGTGHLVLAADLTDTSQVARALEGLASAWGGGLELLVNNAGMGYRARVEELEEATLRQVFETNVLAPLLLARDALPLLREGDSPVVVNVASVVGRRGIPGQSAYAASKAAMCSMGEALRIEWAEEDIAVCTLCPALTATGFFDAQPNPSGLEDPDLSSADPAESVAEEVLALSYEPHPERTLRWKWRLLGALTPFAPRLADRLLVRRLGGGWTVPRR